MVGDVGVDDVDVITLADEDDDDGEAEGFRLLFGDDAAETLLLLAGRSSSEYGR